jgi:beta-barrel assembly-enhancing protease
MIGRKMHTIKLFVSLKYLTLSLLLSFLFISCSDDGSINLYTVQDDVALGRQLDSSIKANKDEYPAYYANPASQYVQDIVNQITQSPLVKYRTIFPFKTLIIYNDSVVNAFATPGGYIYVYTGLMKFLDNEGTLAGILAHEIAHAELRHATKRMTKAYGIQLLLSIVLGNNPSQLEQIGANLFAGLTLMKNSRDDEYEADEYSFKYLQSSKWYPGSIKFFFDKVKANENKFFLEVLLSTHPLSQDRWDKIDALLQENNIPEATESNLFSIQYKAIVATLPK